MDLTPSEQLMYNVLHITMLDEKHMATGTATGFIFGFCQCDNDHITCLVTNRHVLSKCSYILVSFTLAKEDGTPDIGNIHQVELSTKPAIYHPNPSIDLAILGLSNALDSIQSSGRNAFYTLFTSSDIPSQEAWKQYSAIENVVMPGFPRGLRDEVNNQPIIRSGVTATHPSLNYKGRPEFLVDMPCFEGCSGSPVLICDEGWIVNKRECSIYVGRKIELLGVQYAIPSDRIKGQLAITQTAGTAITPVVPL